MWNQKAQQRTQGPDRTKESCLQDPQVTIICRPFLVFRRCLNQQLLQPWLVFGHSRYRLEIPGIPENTQNIQNRAVWRVPGKYSTNTQKVLNRGFGRVPEKCKEKTTGDSPRDLIYTQNIGQRILVDYFWSKYMVAAFDRSQKRAAAFGRRPLLGPYLLQK